MAIDFTAGFTRLGKIFTAQRTINTARGTTIPPTISDILDQFNGSSLDFRKATAQVEASNRSFQQGAAGAMSSLRSTAQSVLIETVKADNPQPRNDLTTALVEWIRQMVVGSQTVDASTAAATVADDSGNSGDGVIVVSAKRADGKNEEHAVPEDIRVEVTSDDSPSTATLSIKGEAAIGDKLSADWPAGSGASSSLSGIDAADSLLTNGDFEDSDDVANLPDDWIASVATPGTTIKTTVYEVQRIVISGPPTAGTYRINWTNPDGKSQSTSPLAYNAAGATVQSALRTLEGLASITVSTTGTTPNFTHDITFTGVAGNLNEVTVTNNTTGGTFTPSTVTAGSANAFIGKTIELDSNGSELTTLNQRVTLAPLTQYAFNIWAKADVVPAAGVITVDLVDGIGGSVINDEAGVANSFTISGPALTTSFVAKNGAFRTPRVLPAVVYLRIRISTAISSGTSVFIDQAALTEMTRLYRGGIFAAAFSGKVSWRKGDGAQVRPDGYTIAVTNDAAGVHQEWFERNFDMSGKGLVLPSNSVGGETIADPA